MTILPIECEPASIWDERAKRDGGWYLVTEDLDESQIIEACQAKSMTGLWVRRSDVNFLSRVSNLKNLNMINDIDDVSPIYELQNPQYLPLISWVEQNRRL